MKIETSIAEQEQNKMATSEEVVAAALLLEDDEDYDYDGVILMSAMASWLLRER